MLNLQAEELEPRLMLSGLSLSSPLLQGVSPTADTSTVGPVARAPTDRDDGGFSTWIGPADGLRLDGQLGGSASLIGSNSSAMATLAAPSTLAARPNVVERGPAVTEQAQFLSTPGTAVVLIVRIVVPDLAIGGPPRSQDVSARLPARPSPTSPIEVANGSGLEAPRPPGPRDLLIPVPTWSPSVKTVPIAAKGPSGAPALSLHPGTQGPSTLLSPAGPQPVPAAPRGLEKPAPPRPPGSPAPDPGALPPVAIVGQAAGPAEVSAELPPPLLSGVLTVLPTIDPTAVSRGLQRVWQSLDRMGQQIAQPRTGLGGYLWLAAGSAAALACEIARRQLSPPPRIQTVGAVSLSGEGGSPPPRRPTRVSLGRFAPVGRGSRFWSRVLGPRSLPRLIGRGFGHERAPGSSARPAQ